MTVQFKNGSVFEYDEVPADKHATFAQNASPGGYFNRRIKPYHSGRAVKE
jgi:hypothetical protein